MLETLQPTAGELLLELGPGTGYYTLTVARQLSEGRLCIVDIQQEMLDHTMRQAAQAGIAERIEPTCADARALPYPDRTFDAAFSVTALGEIPHPDQALREFARVLKPTGRLVIGELLLGDPHVVTFGRLRRLAQQTGLQIIGRRGGALGYFAVLGRSATLPGA